MADNEIKVLIFGLSGENYAIDIGEVERILGYERTTGMPETPSFVEGVINYEDSILPIISLSKKFKLSTVQNVDEVNSKIVVVKRDNNKFGVIVDTVYEVTDIDKDRFENAPEITSSEKINYIKGLIKYDNKIVILLDILKILSKEEEEMIF